MGSDAVLGVMVTIMRNLRALLLLLVSTPAFAQGFGVDLSGQYRANNHEDAPYSGGAMLMADYMGLPINDEARARADSWSMSYMAMPERQCIMYTSHYVVLGPQSLQMTPDIDPISGKVVAWNMTGAIDRTPRKIWMDDRPHPPAVARHTSAGFSTGRWQGETLVVRTTHLTEDTLWRDGVPSSNQATISEYIVRHGNRLTITMILYDPIYLEEPYIRSKTWTYDPTVRMLPEPCEPVWEIARPAGVVPHYLPGTNPFITEMTQKFGIPLEAVRGGARTMYPEFRKTLKQLTASPGSRAPGTRP